DEQLAYCHSHVIRLSAREGVFPITPSGLRALAERDIAAPDSGVSFGKGWYPPYQSAEHPLHRWASNDAEIVVTPPSDGHRTLIFDLEPGPSVCYKPFVLQVSDCAGSVMVETKVQGRTTVAFTLPICSEERQIFRFHVIGGDLPVPRDPH